MVAVHQSPASSPPPHSAVPPPSSTPSITGGTSRLQSAASIFDVDAKGYLDREDVLRGMYILGLDPSPKVLAPVLAELDEQNISAGEGRFRTDHQVNAALDGLLSDASISLDEARALFDYFASNNTCRRDGDSFVYLRRKTYFWLRILSLLTPFAIPVASKILPRYTPSEKSAFRLTRNVIGGFSLILTGTIYLLVVGLVFGLTERHAESLIVMVYCYSVLWMSQAGREANFATWEGYAHHDAVQMGKLALRHTFFTAPTGERTQATAAAARVIQNSNGQTRWTNTMAAVPQHRYWRKQVLGEGAGRLISGPRSEVMDAEGGEKQEAFLETMLGQVVTADEKWVMSKETFASKI